MRTRDVWVAVLLMLLVAPSVEARNFQLKGNNEVSGGFGFQAGFTDYTPGGFKWFNEFSHALGRITWLNVQLNVVLGGDHGWGGAYCGICGYDAHHNPIYCGCYQGFSGYAIETAIGVKLKWRLQKVPLQFHAKFGGIIAPTFFGGGTDGVALGYRGGFGIRYFVVPSLGVGAEFMHDLGPTYINNGVGWHVYATLDFNVGVEVRF